MPARKFTKKKKLSHILFHEFCLHFLRIHQDYIFQRGFESVLVQFLSAQTSITCNLPVQSRLNMAFDVLLSAVFVKYSKLESFVSCNIKLFALCFDMYFFIKT